MSELDPKVIDKIRKLLNLARDGGASEGEANTAMAMAERIMLENNLSMAQIELSGGKASEGRLKEEQRGKANYRWQRWLMTAIARANYVSVGEIVGKRRIGGRNAFRDITLGYELIGRPSNVAGTNTMYEYLLQTCGRLRREYEAEPGNGTKEGALFVEGLAYRLAQRIEERHDELLERQKAEAERQKQEQAARASHPAAAPTGNALVVVMQDYAQSEMDLNNDLRNGWEPGTTLAKRQEEEARALARIEEQRQKEARIQALMEEHNISYGVAWNMVNFKHTLKEAISYEEQFQAEQARQAKRGGSRSSSGGGSRSSSGGGSRYRGGKTREDRLHERLYTGAAGDGRRKGDTVSLDQQIDNQTNRRLR